MTSLDIYSCLNDLWLYLYLNLLEMVITDQIIDTEEISTCERKTKSKYQMLFIVLTKLLKTGSYFWFSFVMTKWNVGYKKHLNSI